MLLLDLNILNLHYRIILPHACTCLNLSVEQEPFFLGQGLNFLSIRAGHSREKQSGTLLLIFFHIKPLGSRLFSDTWLSSSCKISFFSYLYVKVKE